MKKENSLLNLPTQSFGNRTQSPRGTITSHIVPSGTRTHVFRKVLNGQILTCSETCIDTTIEVCYFTKMGHIKCYNTPAEYCTTKCSA